MILRPGSPAISLDPATAWEPWSACPDDPWSLKWAGHLYRRAAFGATWPELQAALDDGPEATIDRLLAGAEGHAEFDRLMDEFAPERGDSLPAPGPGPTAGLQAWWLYRMSTRCTRSASG